MLKKKKQIVKQKVKPKQHENEGKIPFSKGTRHITCPGFSFRFLSFPSENLVYIKPGIFLVARSRFSLATRRKLWLRG